MHPNIALTASSTHLEHARHSLHFRMFFVKVDGERVVRRLVRPQLAPKPDDREKLIRVCAAKFAGPAGERTGGEGGGVLFCCLSWSFDH